MGGSFKRPNSKKKVHHKSIADISRKNRTKSSKKVSFIKNDEEFPDVTKLKKSTSATSNVYRSRKKGRNHDKKRRKKQHQKERSSSIVDRAKSMMNALPFSASSPIQSPVEAKENNSEKFKIDQWDTMN